MSSKSSETAVFQPVVVATGSTHLALAGGAVRIRKNGIEFRSPEPFPPWVEMTVDLESPRHGCKVSCHGVVIACEGNRHAGYYVTMHFTGLTRQSQSSLEQISYSMLA